MQAITHVPTGRVLHSFSSGGKVLVDGNQVAVGDELVVEGRAVVAVEVELRSFPSVHQVVVTGPLPSQPKPVRGHVYLGGPNMRPAAFAGARFYVKSQTPPSATKQETVVKLEGNLIFDEVGEQVVEFWDAEFLSDSIRI
jgi:hypothetical protein